VPVKPQETLDFHLRWAWTKLSRLYNAEADRRGIPFSYVFILLHTERQGTPSTKLGPKMGMESTSLSRTLKGMEAIGLIERRQDANDKRSMRVFLTQNGVAARRQARDLVVSVNDRLRELMGSDAVDRLLIEMKRLNEILDEPSSLMAGLDSGSLPTTSLYE
jgi:MarR family transcriptional regulator, organic hydroperoxide resistance regulator